MAHLLVVRLHRPTLRAGQARTHTPRDVTKARALVIRPSGLATDDLGAVRAESGDAGGLKTAVIHRPGLS